MTDMQNVKRHPIRGFFSGLLAGISISIFLILFSVIALGTKAIYVPIVVGVVLGVVWAQFGPTRTRGGAAAPAATPAPAATE